MTTEEEKLIEELRKYIKLNFDGLDGTSLGISEPGIKIFNIASSLISQAYRAGEEKGEKKGKLAGLEEGEKIVNFFEEKGSMEEEFRYFIEEEKKKL